MVLTLYLMRQVVVLVGLESLARYLPEAEADNVDSWKATLYRRLNGVRMFDRPVPLLLVRRRRLAEIPASKFLQHTQLVFDDQSWC